MIEGVGDAFGIGPAGTAIVALGEIAMEVEGEKAKGRDGGREPVLGDEACRLTGGGGKEPGCGLDDVDPVVGGCKGGKRVCGRKTNDTCAENDCGGHVVYVPVLSRAGRNAGEGDGRKGRNPDRLCPRPLYIPSSPAADPHRTAENLQ